MSKRIVLGPRANGDVGLFVSPPGVDADIAADSALLLSATSKVSQLILLGNVAASGTPTTIVLGLSRSPFVFVTSQFDFAGVIGHTTGPGPLRPSPPIGSSFSAATINSNGASMTITRPLKTTFAVYGAAFT
jgi:hypothetical protein